VELAQCPSVPLTHHGACTFSPTASGILAACEDLLLPEGDAAERFRLELAAIIRVLQARRHIEALDETEPEVIDQGMLFLAGTASLELAQLAASPALPRR
jgi:hypothetical protein